ncbi:hypothetical protein RR48_06235 [Papilio machaon]|uniref:Uncharacterized protein n=1 Tax=Papilio machaon TaxID=76193 RepID=A0A194QTF6_PAPMA|nr:hypothetical protein RR48_06235 [Papilio machaon]
MGNSITEIYKVLIDTSAIASSRLVLFIVQCGDRRPAINEHDQLSTRVRPARARPSAASEKRPYRCSDDCTSVAPISPYLPQPHYVRQVGLSDPVTECSAPCRRNCTGCVCGCTVRAPLLSEETARPSPYTKVGRAAPAQAQRVTEEKVGLWSQGRVRRSRVAQPPNIIDAFATECSRAIVL